MQYNRIQITSQAGSRQVVHRTRSLLIDPLYTLQVASKGPAAIEAVKYTLLLPNGRCIRYVRNHHSVSVAAKHARLLAAPEPLIHMHLVSLCHFASKQQRQPSLVRPQRRNDASDCFNPLYTNQIMHFGDLR
jgi:hypothetical protein